MEILFSLPYLVLEVPNVKIKRPSWFHQPSPFVTYAFILVSYFLVTGDTYLTPVAEEAFDVVGILAVSKCWKVAATLKPDFSVILAALENGIIYDVIIEPPSIGSTMDEHGHSRPVAFMPYRVNGQYIMEGLAASFLFILGGLGFVILDRTHNPSTPKLHRILLITVGFLCIVISFATCWVFMRMKLPGYLRYRE